MEHYFRWVDKHSINYKGDSFVVEDVGSSDAIISRFLLKHSLTWLVICWFICISYNANIAILCSYSRLFISPHLLRRGRSLDVAPFIFSDAMFIFTFFPCLSLSRDYGLFFCGVGMRWCLCSHDWHG